MLFNIDSGKRITTRPYADTMKTIIDRIPDDELHMIYAALNDMIEGTEIQTSSWMPGNDWTDTSFEAIYSKAALKHERLAAKMFGLIVWNVFQSREDEWFCGHFDLDGEAIGGITYFRKQF